MSEKKLKHLIKFGFRDCNQHSLIHHPKTLATKMHYATLMQALIQAVIAVYTAFS